MNYILFTGTTAAGKDIFIEDVFERTKKDYPEVNITNAWYYTTRNELRPGEKRDHRFLTDAEFDEKVKNNEIFMPGKNAGYQVGYPMPKKDPERGIVVMNIMPEGAREMKVLAEKAGGKCLMIYIDAPKEQRVERIRRRESWLIYEPAEYKANNDITESGFEKYPDYDLHVENKDGDLEKNKEIIWKKTKEFLDTIYGTK